MKAKSLNIPALNISGKLDSSTVAVYQAILHVTQQLDVPFLIVGASARDLVLHYGHNADIARATRDIDFAIEVANWDAFQQVKAVLIARGFKESDQQHRVTSPQGIPLDIVPFGPLEDATGKIEWPPGQEWEMLVQGFQEALDNAEAVIIQDKPLIEVPVATPAGMALLKLIAWQDREVEKRGKDAADFLYLCESYEKIPAVSDGLYKNESLMESYEWDLTLAAASQLGQDARAIAKALTASTISTLLNNKHETLAIGVFISEMAAPNVGRAEELLEAFTKGFNELHWRNSE
ncbi:nucleotidyl transferase AbiEii/AbiGii toxin family protein [Agaribacterium haliotis]|uniref:nucleotidyl transferase AbiEii/AbiGii toxin family protein n=1 Tax=Agaribacterium haliotis TaxID=2013869 RepID=UPI000BB53E86|nr:nucleotidyl transferase AbiEii/AbiGii toxin family protein [Agaribacterium haliotis]